MNEFKIFITKDGSASLYSPYINDTYHSRRGAAAESNHVFIKNGLEYAISIQQKTNIQLLEVGFGTGLNALLCLELATKHTAIIHYKTIDTTPIPLEILPSLNFEQLIDTSQIAPLFQLIHQVEWSKKLELLPNFIFEKQLIALQELKTNTKFDVIFYDAFAPNNQPEMWTLAVFQQLYELTAEGGFFVTYCSKGVVNRTIKEAGFYLERLQGPPGKREMIRGVKK